MTRDWSKECVHVFRVEEEGKWYRVELDATILATPAFETLRLTSAQLLEGRLDGVAAPELRPESRSQKSVLIWHRRI